MQYADQPRPAGSISAALTGWAAYLEQTVRGIQPFLADNVIPAADHLERLLLRAPLAQLSPRVLVDYTGVGRLVFDVFAQRPALRRAQGVVITGGRETSGTPAGWSVPKG